MSHSAEARIAFKVTIHRLTSDASSLRAEQKPADKITRRILREVITSDPITARHALALAVDFARKVHLRWQPTYSKLRLRLSWIDSIQAPMI